MIRHNHWMTYSYNNVINGRKSTPICDFNLHFNKTKITAKTFRQALYHNATILEQQIQPPYDVLLSGGIDSEIIVRVNNDSKRWYYGEKWYEIDISGLVIKVIKYN